MKTNGSGVGERWTDRVSDLFEEIAMATSQQPPIEGWSCVSVRLKMYAEGDGNVVAEWSHDQGGTATTVVHKWLTRDELMPWLEEKVEEIHHPVWSPSAVFRPTELLREHAG